MNRYSKLIVQQANNEYRIWTPQGFCIAHIVLPADCQYIMDSKVLEYVCRALSIRWGFQEPK